MLDEAKKQELGKELLVDFHRQFTESQTAREQSFLKILGFLGAVIFGYAYVFNNTIEKIRINEANRYFDLGKLSLVSIMSEIILCFGSFIIVVMAYNFRRSQVVEAEIRKFADVLGEGKAFPLSFNPKNSFIDDRKFTWMPDFLAIYYFIFPIVHIILYSSYLWLSIPDLCKFNIWGCFVATTIIFAVSLIAIILYPFHYYEKLKVFIQTKNN